MTSKELLEFIVGNNGAFGPMKLRGVYAVPVFFGLLSLGLGYWLGVEACPCDRCPFFFAIFVGLLGGIGMLQLRTIFIPYILVCLQVNAAIQPRIGLWNQHDPALVEMQRLSFSLTFKVTVSNAFIIAGMFSTRIPWTLPVFNTIGAIAFIGVILLLPILPVAYHLAAKKRALLSEVASALEDQHRRVLMKLRTGEDNSAEMEQLERTSHYHKTVLAVNIYPEPLKIIYTGSISTLVAVAPLALAYAFPQFSL